MELREQPARPTLAQKLGDGTQFLLSQEQLSPDELRTAFARARVPDVPEIRELFLAAPPKVLKLASRISN